MKIKCPECDEVMMKTEDQHICEACDHTLTLTEAEELFDDGKLIGVIESDDTDVKEEGENPFAKKDDKKDSDDDKGDDKDSDDDKAEKKDSDDDKEDDKDMKKEEGFNGFTNKETWASAIVTENEYSLLKKVREAHKKEKLDSRFVKSLVEGVSAEGDLAEVFESIDLEAVEWSEVSDHFTQVMKESEVIGVDVANVLFADTELNEEQKDEMVNIFETAVDIKVNEIKAGLLEDQEVKVEEAIAIKEAELETKTSEYVDLVIEEWYEDNKIAIENSLKVDFAETFLNGIHDLFEESYINVPEDRFDVLESLNDRITKYEEYEVYVEGETQKLENTIVEMKKEAAVVTLTEGMIETEKEKLADIVESVDYKDKDQFVAEVTKLKEAFISKADTHLNEKEDDTEEDKVSGIDADIAKAAIL